MEFAESMTTIYELLLKLGVIEKKKEFSNFTVNKEA